MMAPLSWLSNPSRSANSQTTGGTPVVVGAGFVYPEANLPGPARWHDERVVTRTWAGTKPVNDQGHCQSISNAYPDFGPRRHPDQRSGDEKGPTPFGEGHGFDAGAALGHRVPASASGLECQSQRPPAESARRVDVRIRLDAFDRAVRNWIWRSLIQRATDE